MEKIRILARLLQKNIKMRLLAVFFVLFLFAGLKADAIALQQPGTAKPIITKKTLQNDSSSVNLRTIDERAVDTYSKQKEFIYDDVAVAKLSLWDRFWRWFWKTVYGLLNSKNVGGLIRYGLTALAIAIVVFIIIKLTGVDFKLFFGKSKTVSVPYEESLENIHEIDFDEQLTQALANGNYRLAVRLLYLRTLKKLTDKNLIYWQLEKTNQAYVAELTDEKQQAAFKLLTNQFEYIWYGEFFIDKNTFSSINESFQQFNQQLI